MVDKKTWDEFRNTGLFLTINSILHIFGWAIVLQIDDDGRVTNAYPARVKFRGFSNEDITESHKKIADYLKQNIDALVEETKL